VPQVSWATRYTNVWLAYIVLTPGTRVGLVNMSVKGPLVFYDCDTEEGSSGAPVLKVEDNQLKIVAVHRGKSPGNVNYGSLMYSILQHVATGRFDQPRNCRKLCQTIVM